MSIEKAVFTILSENVGVIAAFGTRVYADQIPDGTTMPVAVISLIDSVPIQGIRQQTDWSRARVQVEVYGVGKQSVVESTQTIKDALRRYHGTVDAVVIDDVMLESERSDFDTESGVRVASLDFICYFEE